MQQAARAICTSQVLLTVVPIVVALHRTLLLKPSSCTQLQLHLWAPPACFEHRFMLLFPAVSLTLLLIVQEAERVVVATGNYCSIDVKDTKPLSKADRPPNPTFVSPRFFPTTLLTSH